MSTSISVRPAWGAGHYLALSAGTTLTYTLFGLAAFLQGHTNLGLEIIKASPQVAG